MSIVVAKVKLADAPGAKGPGNVPVSEATIPPLTLHTMGMFETGKNPKLVISTVTCSVAENVGLAQSLYAGSMRAVTPTSGSL